MKTKNIDTTIIPLEKSRKNWKIKYEDQPTIIEMMSNWVTKKEIAKMLGVARQTFYSYLERNPHFARRVEASQVREKYQDVKSINEQIRNGDGRLALDKAKVRYEEFKPKQEIQNNTQVVTILTDIRAVNKGNRENSLSDTRKELPMIENTWEVAKMHTAKEDEIT